ncbi:glycoside hydrolase superfamily [Gaertneriomyces semiglobifer]|nr:glycoside hydrolase superfamily [Gaertneriomyces semiglobifer]
MDSDKAADSLGLNGTGQRSLLPLLLVVEECPQDLVAGLQEIARHCLHKNFRTIESMMMLDEENMERIAVKFHYDEQLPERSVSVRPSHYSLRDVPSDEKYAVHVSYRRQTEAFRAVGRMLGVLFDIEDVEDLSAMMTWDETAQFESLGAMTDNSRSATLTTEAVLFLLRTCALLGLNTFQLYTEDTYEIPNEPFFGYLRGGFTQVEMSLIDQYAAAFGIEVIACIQTLGHLGQILQWPRFASVRDTHEVLLANSEETYQLIEKMIESASRPLRSKRIHIGMDEAHGVGEGRYRQLFGDKDSSQVFLAHVRRVKQICLDRGLVPMVWSDMLFTLAAKNSSLQSYYDTSDLPQEMKHKVPSDTDYIYWDYYHTQPEAYTRKIEQHRNIIGRDPWVAGGIWSWNRFYSALPFTFAASDACLKACKQNNVRNVFVTQWGDDGNECDVMSALPGFVYYAEHGYTSSLDVDWNMIRRAFAAVCGGNLEHFVYASKIDVPLESMDRTRFPPNVSKWLLWNDPLYGFLGPQYQNLNIDLESVYSELAKTLDAASTQELALYPLNSRLQFPAKIARVLSLKANLRQYLQQAYKSDNPKAQLYQLARGPIRELRKAVDALWRYHRDNIWLSTYKPYGSEIVEMRYGAQRTRCQTLEERVLAFVGERGEPYVDEDHSGQSAPTFPVVGPGRADLSELEADLSEVYPGLGCELVLDFARSYTPSRALGTG